MQDNYHVDQKAALGSTTTQVGVQNNYIGMTPEKACELATKLFMDNFPKLQEEAMKVARQRADEFMAGVIKKLEEKKSVDYSAFSDPDVQYVLLEAQCQYARIGKEDRLDILTELIVQRVASNENSTKNIIIDQAITTSAFLTGDQLDTMAMILLTKNSSIHCASLELLKDEMEYWCSVFQKADKSHLSFLNSQKCLELRPISIHDWMSRILGFDKDDIKQICPSQIAALNSDYGLSLIGKAIAITYVQSKTYYRFDIDSYLSQ